MYRDKRKRGERTFEFFHDKGLKVRPKTVIRKALLRMFAISKLLGVIHWYAHNGGKYDVCLLLPVILELGGACTGYIAGGRLISLRITVDGVTINLYDSYSVVPSALDKASLAFDLPTKKIFKKEDYSKVKRWSVAKMRKGCWADCQIVLELLDKVEGFLISEGGELKATTASCAFNLLKSSVAVLDMREHSNVNEWVRDAYYGGRVEVYRHLPDEWLGEWDVNSSYPWSMTGELPWMPREIVVGVRARQSYETGRPCVVEATVRVPQMAIPPLPFRSPDKSLYYPVGEWRGRWVGEELRYAESLGVEVLKVHACLPFTRSSPFKDFIHMLHKKKSEGDGASRLFYKLMMNACYGKFGQKPEKEILRIMPDADAAMDFIYNAQPDSVRELSSTDIRFLGVETVLWSKQTHYGIAATITARSRILLHKRLIQSTRPAYADTDSVHAAVKSKLPTGIRLGDLKLEVDKMRAIYYAPKLYTLELVTPLIKPDGKKQWAVHKSKGFPVDGETFGKIIKGEDVSFERMQLIRRQISVGHNEPARVTDIKAWSGNSSKRKPFENGETEPWSTNEIENELPSLAISPALGRKLLSKRRSQK